MGFVPYQDDYVPNQDDYVPNQDDYVPYQDDYVPNQDDYMGFELGTGSTPVFKVTNNMCPILFSPR